LLCISTISGSLSDAMAGPMTDAPAGDVRVGMVDERVALHSHNKIRQRGSSATFSQMPSADGGRLRDPLEMRLIEALKTVDVHGDVAPPYVHDPMTMLLRENAIQANFMRWDDARCRYVLTGTGRRRISAGSRTPGTVVSFRRRGVVGTGPMHQEPANLKE
jgi:hypothetical protein